MVSSDNLITVHRKSLHYAPCDYANTRCFSRGRKQTISTVNAVQLLLTINARTDPIARETPFRPEEDCAKYLKSRRNHSEKKDTPVVEDVTPEPTTRIEALAVERSSLAVAVPTATSLPVLSAKNGDCKANEAEQKLTDLTIPAAIKAIKSLIKLDGEEGSFVYCDMLYSRLAMTQINNGEISQTTKKSLGSTIGKAMKRAFPEIGKAKKTGKTKRLPCPYAYHGVSFVCD